MNEQTAIEVGTGNDEVAFDVEAQAAEQEPEKEPIRLTWYYVNEQLRFGSKAVMEGHYTKPDDEGGRGRYVSAMVDTRPVVSESGYQTGYSARYGKEDFEWAEGSEREAYRMFKRNALSIQVWTPWIPVPDGEEAERIAMMAYSEMLRTGKLPRVDSSGRLEGGSR